MKTWTSWDKALSLIPLLVATTLVALKGFSELELNNAANQTAKNINSIATAVHQYHSKTGRWFPTQNTQKHPDQTIEIYIDVFAEKQFHYQGLEAEWFSRENNQGLVLQLVSFDSSTDLPTYLFDLPFKNGEPYLRVLLDYGDRFAMEAELLLRVQEQLPANTLAEVDDHYYVVDLRGLMYERQ